MSAFVGYRCGLDVADSEGDFTKLVALGAIFVGPFIGVGWLCWASWQPSIRKILRGLTKLLCLMTLVFFSAFYLASSFIAPSHIRFRFGYGASGTWHEVQFHHLENGQWIEGPWVGAWPMQVRFPDLNQDGHADIEVTGRGRVAFLYQPEHVGTKYWHLQEKEGHYGVSYPPAGLIYP
ncbi:MAG: hypothetical protein ABL974_16215 [Prosthecobacter sp.]